MDGPTATAYHDGMFRLWFVGEAGWRHNRVHLFLAAISVVLALTAQSVGAVVTAVVIAGSLWLRIVMWDRARTGATVEVRRVVRK
jgi:hypothetical protein